MESFLLGIVFILWYPLGLVGSVIGHKTIERNCGIKYEWTAFEYIMALTGPVNVASTGLMRLFS